MPTSKQALGQRGEKAVHDNVSCPRCGRARHLTQLRQNFQCADLICKFCGYLAQVKAVTLDEGREDFPSRVPGAAWSPQHEQIMADIYHGLFLVGFRPTGRLVRIDFIPGHILRVSPKVFEPRKPLRPQAKRAGWTGFVYNLDELPPVGRHTVYPSS